MNKRKIYNTSLLLVVLFFVLFCCLSAEVNTRLEVIETEINLLIGLDLSLGIFFRYLIIMLGAFIYFQLKVKKQKARS